jgi:WD40 repeat protein
MRKYPFIGGLALCLAVLFGVQSSLAQAVRFQETLRLPIDHLCALTFSPDGEQLILVTATDDDSPRLELARYAAKTAEKREVLHTAPVFCPSPRHFENRLVWQGQYVVAAFEDGLHVWKADEPFQKRYSLPPTLFALHAGLNRLITVSDPYLILRDLASGREVARHRITQVLGSGKLLHDIARVAWSASGAQVLISDNRLTRLLTLKADVFTERSLTLDAGNRLHAATWWDDNTVLTVERQSLLHTWDATSGEQRQVKYLKGGSPAFSPDKRWVAVSDEASNPVDAPENVIKVFALPEARLVAKLPFTMSAFEGSRVLLLTFSEDGTRLAAIIDSERPTLYIWRAF